MNQRHVLRDSASPSDRVTWVGNQPRRASANAGAAGEAAAAGEERQQRQRHPDGTWTV